MSDYKCSYCGRSLSQLDDVCQCGNSVGVLDL